jgi:predicted transcriptional regulator
MRDVYPTSIRLESHLKQALEHYAQREQRSLSWLIADILRCWCEQEKERDRESNASS